MEVDVVRKPRIWEPEVAYRMPEMRRMSELEVQPGHPVLNVSSLEARPNVLRLKPLQALILLLGWAALLVTPVVVRIAYPEWLRDQPGHQLINAFLYMAGVLPLVLLSLGTFAVKADKPGSHQ